MKTTRFIPTGYTLYKKTPHTEIYTTKGPLSGNNGRLSFAAMGFVGKSSKPAFHYGFPTEDKDMAPYVDTFIGRVESNLKARAESKKARKERQDAEMAAVKVGDMFSYSWGYDQTNVEFFQVIEKKAKSFVMMEIGAKHLGEAPAGGMSDYVTPVPYSFMGDMKPIIKTSFSMPHGVLSKISEGEKRFCSWYA